MSGVRDVEVRQLSESRPVEQIWWTPGSSCRRGGKVIDVKIAPAISAGYISGVGDQVPPAIQQLGARLTFIDQDELAWGDLSKYDVIVTGVRAYERRSDLRAYNHRLLDYVERGGTVVVQRGRRRRFTEGLAGGGRFCPFKEPGTGRGSLPTPLPLRRADRWSMSCFPLLASLFSAEHSGLAVTQSGCLLMPPLLRAQQIRE